MAVSGTRVDVGTDANRLLRDLLERERRAGESAGGQLMSLYLNLDPREYATPGARQSEVTALLDRAAREAPDHSWDRVIDDLRETFASESYEIDDAQGIAIIASADGDVELLKLRRPVRRRVVFGDHPYLRPLLETIPTTGWCVALVNSRCARFLLGSAEELHVVRALRDEVTGRHDQGGWSQARFERVVEGEIKDHVKRAAAELLPLHQAGLFRQMLAGGPQEVRPMFESALHPYVRPAFRGWIDVDVENVTPEQVHEIAMPVIERLEREQQAQLLERLQANLATDGRATHGLSGVLEALNEQRVDTLLVAENFSAQGVRCRSCGWLGAEGDWTSCPVDEGELCDEPDIVECAIEAAVLQSAHTVNVGRDNAAPGVGEVDADDGPRNAFLQLQGLGSIAALLRF